MVADKIGEPGTSDIVSMPCERAFRSDADGAALHERLAELRSWRRTCARGRWAREVDYPHLHLPTDGRHRNGDEDPFAHGTGGSIIEPREPIAVLMRLPGDPTMHHAIRRNAARRKRAREECGHDGDCMVTG